VNLRPDIAAFVWPRCYPRNLQVPQNVLNDQPVFTFARAINQYKPLHHTHRQEGALAPLAQPLSPRKHCKVFFVPQMLSKDSVEEVFIHCCEKMSSASGSLPPNPHWGYAHEPHWETSVFRSPYCAARCDTLFSCALQIFLLTYLLTYCPPMKKNPAGAHGHTLEMYASAIIGSSIWLWPLISNLENFFSATPNHMMNNWW